MKTRLIAVLMTCMCSVAWPAHAQSLDQEMAGLADKLSKALVAKGCKSVAAVDFTDLQGQPTELGRYLSEQLAVEIVMTTSVSMVDRANIKNILAEHKLTEEGLVRPENAKKLGEFAGVDTILIGNATALDDDIVLMVKAISTSSATIVAAGKAKFAKTREVQQLLNRGISSASPILLQQTGTSAEKTVSSYQESSALATKDIGPLRIALKSVLPIKLKNKNGRSIRGIRCSVELTNLDTRRSVLVAANARESERGDNLRPDWLRTTLVDETGGLWRLSASNIVGLAVVSVGERERPGCNGCRDPYNATEIASLLGRQDELKTNVQKDRNNVYHTFVLGSAGTIEPGLTAKVTMNFFLDADEDEVGTAPQYFQLDVELVTGAATPDEKTKYALQNVTFDRIAMPSSLK